MIAFKLNKSYFTGETLDAPKGIAPRGYTFTNPGTTPEGMWAILTKNGVEYTATPPPTPVPGVSVEPYYGTRITRLAFRNRFTFAEKVALETAAESNATLRVMMKDQESATCIDLGRQDTIDGVNALVGLTLLTEERATEILTTPVQEIEAYNG